MGLTCLSSQGAFLGLEPSAVRQARYVYGQCVRLGLHASSWTRGHLGRNTVARIGRFNIFILIRHTQSRTGGWQAVMTRYISTSRFALQVRLRPSCLTTVSLGLVATDEMHCNMAGYVNGSCTRTTTRVREAAPGPPEQDVCLLCPCTLFRILVGRGTAPIPVKRTCHCPPGVLRRATRYRMMLRGSVSRKKKKTLPVATTLANRCHPRCG